MRMRKMVCMVLVCSLIIGSISIPAYAAEDSNTNLNYIISITQSRATGSFSVSLPANAKAIANSSFPLAAGETVTIKASYSPFSASVDFGLVAPDGRFYYFNIVNGSIDKTIQVDESGNYTFQIWNHSSTEVQVSGFINY